MSGGRDPIDELAGSRKRRACRAASDLRNDPEDEAPPPAEVVPQAPPTAPFAFEAGFDASTVASPKGRRILNTNKQRARAAAPAAPTGVAAALAPQSGCSTGSPAGALGGANAAPPPMAPLNVAALLTRPPAPAPFADLRTPLAMRRPPPVALPNNAPREPGVVLTSPATPVLAPGGIPSYEGNQRLALSKDGQLTPEELHSGLAPAFAAQGEQFTVAEALALFSLMGGQASLPMKAFIQLVHGANVEMQKVPLLLSLFLVVNHPTKQADRTTAGTCPDGKYTTPIYSASVLSPDLVCGLDRAPQNADQMFNWMDESHDGRELRIGLSRILNQQVPLAEAIKLGNLYKSSDASSTLDRTEFCEMLKDMNSYLQAQLYFQLHESSNSRSLYLLNRFVMATWWADENLLDLFREVDTDQNGVLNPVELAQVLIRFGVTVTEQDVAAFMVTYDRNRDNNLDLSEFASLISNGNDTIRDIFHSIVMRDCSQAQVTSQKMAPISWNPTVQFKNVIDRLLSQLIRCKLSIRQVFQQFDKDHNEHLSMAELADGLSALGVPTDEATTQALVSHCDLSRNGFIEMDEFCGLIYHIFEYAQNRMRFALSNLEERRNEVYRHILAAVTASGSAFNVENVFTYLDLNRNQQITMEELYSGIQRIGIHIPRSQVVCMFHSCDTNGDGSLSREEFCGLLMVSHNC
eukprot:gene4354-790_t